MIKYFIEYNHALYGVFDSAEEACNFALSKFEFPEWGLNDMRFLPMRFIPPPAVESTIVHGALKHVIFCDDNAYGVFDTPQSAADYALHNFKGMRWSLRYLNMVPL